jgi:hypothetical protein
MEYNEKDEFGAQGSCDLAGFEKKAAAAPIGGKIAGSEGVGKRQSKSRRWPRLPSVIVRGLHGDIRLWNPSAEITYGWSKEEAVGKVTHSLFQTQFPCPVEEINRRLVENKFWEGELIHTLNDGSTVKLRSRWELQNGDNDQNCTVFEINSDFEPIDLTNLSARENAKWEIRRTWRLMKEKKWWWLVPMLISYILVFLVVFFTEEAALVPLP